MSFLSVGACASLLGPVGGQRVHVGACCDACAKSKPCSGEGATCAPRSTTVGAVYVSDAELHAFGEAVTLMSGDVNAAADAERQSFATGVATGAAMTACFAAGLAWDKAANQCKQEPDPEHKTYGPGPGLGQPLTDFQNEQWTPFVLRWNDYVASSVHLPGTFYNELLPAFHRLHDEWTGPLGQTTRAKVLKPADEGFPWGWAILAGGIVLLPFYLPPLTGLVLYALKGKIPGLEALMLGGLK